MSIKSQILAFALTVAAVLASAARERLIVLNEGTWQADNGRVTYFEDGAVVSNQWFSRRQRLEARRHAQ